ncbi:hypothetical protein AV656_15080 [Bhargavaea cecembensis]|uniref:Spore coat protein n=1 Tax=Bhargavaea cecembensis TaxID=394098 RepID=A0A163EGR5_9BACL|nr:hypothetical protein [Bhargavaea cecembensis]KZE36457.1 hypothetical protein AV656_15080 [Bhargavaea cecembensis]
MTDKDTGKEASQSTDQATDKQNQQESGDASNNKQQDQNDGSLNDKEMAILLLGMEEQLCQLYQSAENATYSSKLESLLSSFLQTSNSNRRNLRDLITRHGWMTPDAAKREDYEKVLQKFEGSAPPVV